MRGKQVSCEKGCTWKGMFGQEYEEHLKECRFMTASHEKASVAIPDTPMVGVTQSGDKLISLHLIEDDKLKKALSPHRDPQNEAKDAPNKMFEPMKREGAKRIGPMTPRGLEMDCQQPKMDRRQPEMDRRQPEMDRRQPEMDRRQPEMDRRQPEMDCRQPEMDQKPINMDKTHVAQLIVSLVLGGMDKSSFQDIVPKEEAFLKLRELVRNYPEAMDLFLKSLKLKCDSMNGIREVSVGLVQDGQGEMHSTVMRESVLGPKDLSKVYKEIYEVRENWYSIGLELNVPPEDLDHIKFTHPNDAMCLREVLRMWLTRREDEGQLGENPTWQSLIQALRSPTIEKGGLLADKLERKHFRAGGGRLSDRLDGECYTAVLGRDLDENDLRDLYRELYAIREHWYNLGLELGVSPATLEQIRHGYNDPLCQVLRHWLHSEATNKTLRTLCNALQSVTVGKYQLAHRLERTHKFSSADTSELKCDREEVMALLEELLTPEIPSNTTPSVQHSGSGKRLAEATAEELPPPPKRLKETAMNTQQQKQSGGHGNIMISANEGASVNITVAPSQPPAPQTGGRI